MKKLILMVPVFVFALSLYALAAEIDTIPDIEGSETNKGMFCNVEKSEVCVITRGEEDCTKLEGKKSGFMP